VFNSEQYRFLKLEITDETTYWWSIHELYFNIVDIE